MLSEDPSLLYRDCHSCHKNSHLLRNCPVLKPVINRSHLIHRYNYSLPQKRKSFIRRKKDKTNSLGDREKVQNFQYFFNLNQEKIESHKNHSLIINSMESHELSPLLKNSENETNKKTEADELKKNESEIEIHEEENNKEESLVNSSNKIVVSNKNDNFLIGFESLKIFKKYQTEFNYDVILMLLKKEYFFRLKRSKSTRNPRKKKLGKNYLIKRKGFKKEKV